MTPEDFRSSFKIQLSHELKGNVEIPSITSQGSVETER